MRRWLGAGCAAGLICGCILASTARAQTAPVAKDDAPKQKAKTSGAKKHSSTSAESKAETSTPAAKTHRAPHPAVGTKSKSNTAASAHGSSSKAPSSRKTGKRRTARRQQKIDSERAQAIQEALIREHYLTGQAAGTWNQASEDAMRRYQAEHGWQAKTVPDP